MQAAQVRQDVHVMMETSRGYSGTQGVSCYGHKTVEDCQVYYYLLIGYIITN